MLTSCKEGLFTKAMSETELSMMANNNSRVELLSGVFSVWVLLAGCGAIRLHDESRARMSTGIKEKYAQADVLGVINVEKKNLDNLLAEELKVVRDNHNLQVDFALLRIADDNTPMAETYTTKARNRLADLGYPAGFKELRQFRLAEVDLSVGETEMQDHSTSLKALTKTTPPPCRPGVVLPNKIGFPGNLTAAQREGADNFYRLYREACGVVQKKFEHQPTSGLIKQAFDEWQAARDEVARLDQPLTDAHQDLKLKKEAYDRALEALDQAKGRGPQKEKELTDKADLLKQDFEVTRDISGFIDNKSAATERAGAIIVLLAAAAGTEINTSDAELRKAANIAKEIPSLAGDIRGLIEQARAPSVNNLLTELNHQVVLLEYAKRLRTLAQQRVDILRTRYDALTEESRFWSRFGDAVCSYAVVSAGEKFPGTNCDNFEVKSDEKTTCIWGKSSVREDCILAKSWNENIRSQSNDAATRELYKALAAYLQALAVQASQHEQTFRLIDVRHQETLASRESALRAWDNLVSVPVNQIEAYYQAGLKPPEIADLIVKALGFTAIAVGVAQ
jgi:hypothetical protein